MFLKSVLKQFECPHFEKTYSRNTRLNKHLEEIYEVIGGITALTASRIYSEQPQS